ncbi:MAG: hypothetical protein BGO67_08660 [Alphaproteobacteria bacterium 41-28]|nr:MAG: hypothetical protein BGO67_08660 [Alphaproteobacteria bacterium 41-28]
MGLEQKPQVSSLLVFTGISSLREAEEVNNELKFLDRHAHFMGSRRRLWEAPPLVFARSFAPKQSRFFNFGTLNFNLIGHTN